MSLQSKLKADVFALYAEVNSLLAQDTSSFNGRRQARAALMRVENTLADLPVTISRLLRQLNEEEIA